MPPPRHHVGRSLIWLLSRISHGVARRLGRRVERVKGDRLQDLAGWISRGGLDEHTELTERVDRDVLRLQGELAREVHETLAHIELEPGEASQACALVSSSVVARRLLVHLVDRTRPQWVVEFGTAFGIGAIALCHGLASFDDGRFDSIEIDSWKADFAQPFLDTVLPGRATVHVGAIESVLPRLVGSAKRSIDLAFVDAAHTYDDTFRYHTLLRGNVSDGAIVVYDDIYWSAETMACWTEILRQPEATDAICVDRQWGVVRYSGRPA